MGALTAGLLAALVLAFLTPPGRAIATDIGKLVGIGDEPTLRVPLGGPAVVIGVGDAARTYRYEVVAANNTGSANPETCVFVQFPEIGPHGGGNCLTEDSRRSLPLAKVEPFVYRAPSEFQPDAELIVQGLATPDVARVSVTYTTSDGARTEAPVQMSSLEGELSRQIGVADEAGFFFAFLPPGVLHGEPDDPHILSPCSVENSLADVEVAAYDEAGSQLAAEDLGEPWNARSLVALPPSGFAEPRPPDAGDGGGGSEAGAPTPWRDCSGND